ncbi:MAG: UDP-N-acetylenolpyruvoylglucosamine reductase, partial [Clostridiales bacterium]|nr:UDP-N-acetylenolpyruvoylglucosamine reductase [Clostridiales bacterium]
DIVQLIGTAQAVVYDAFGIRLEREIKLLGDFF